MAKRKNDKTRRLTTSAVLSALGVVLMYLGTVTEILDLSAVAIASLCCVFAVIEYSGAYPWLIYAVTGVLSLALLPRPDAAVTYLLFFGYYPIIKEKIEGKISKKWLSWLIKEGVFNLAFAIVLILSKLVLAPEAQEPLPLYIAYIAGIEVMFPLYDVALTKLITLYIYKIRKKFRLK